MMNGKPILNIPICDQRLYISVELDINYDEAAKAQGAEVGVATS